MSEKGIPKEDNYENQPVEEKKVLSKEEQEK